MGEAKKYLRTLNETEASKPPVEFSEAVGTREVWNYKRSFPKLDMGKGKGKARKFGTSMQRWFAVRLREIQSTVASIENASNSLDSSGVGTYVNLLAASTHLLMDALDGVEIKTPEDAM